MAYKVLYRKYRPSTFSEVVGQGEVINSLQNCIINNNFSHAYIFSGPRGTGKTSVAKIFARALNCLNCENGNPCGKCLNCQSFDSSPDVVEIDAASNNGVDEIREIRDNVTIAPSVMKYKVYIIDEVHMLSTGAFNALLKTLEEPPEHIMFILATTEIYKVPITILSRCQRFDFKKISRSEMVTYLKTICKKEKFEYDESALNTIFMLSDGCMRDALSILDQISKISHNAKNEELLKTYSVVSNEVIEQLVEDVKKGNVGNIIEFIDNFENTGVNIQRLIKQFVSILEDYALSIAKDETNIFNFNITCQLIRKLCDCYNDARINDNSYLILKLCFMEVLNENYIKQKQKEYQIKQNKDTIEEIRLNNCLSAANKSALMTIRAFWKKLKEDTIEQLDLTKFLPIVSSPDYTIFETELEEDAKLFNENKKTVEKFLSKNALKIKVAAITRIRWLEEIETYKEMKKSGLFYSIIEEPKKSKQKKKKRIPKLNELFDNEIIEYEKEK